MKADEDKFLAAVGSCRLMLMKLAGLYAEDRFGQEDLAQEILFQARRLAQRSFGRYLDVLFNNIRELRADKVLLYKEQAESANR